MFYLIRRHVKRKKLKKIHHVLRIIKKAKKLKIKYKNRGMEAPKNWREGPLGGWG
jgi:hypothetical protein